MANVTFEIKKNIAVLSTSKKGWTTEANMVSWNGAPAKLDIRDWDPNHEKMGKGITLTQEEVTKLIAALVGEPKAEEPAPAPAPQPKAEEPKPAPQPAKEEPKPQPKEEKSEDEKLYAGMTAAMIEQIKAARAKMGK